MRVMILGAGNAGRILTAKLCEEKHDVVLVDKNPEPLAEVQAKLDILTIEGEGSNPHVLERAGIAKTDLLVAVTDRDEINILSCILAHSAGVPHKIVRVSNLDYIRPPKRFDLKKLGVDMIVSQKEECAQELFNILRMPGTLESVDVLDGRVLAVGIKIHMDSQLLMGPLKAFPQPERLQAIRFIALMRGEKLIIPHGDTQFLVGDDIYFVGRPENVHEFIQWAWPEHHMFEKIVIAGGGDLGLLLARLLEDRKRQVVLIERNEARAEYCSGILNRTLVIKGDALDKGTLKNSGNIEGAAFVAVVGSDENNIIGCLLAADSGARFTCAQVTKPEYVPIIDEMSLLDRAVSPPLSMINSILHYIRGKHVKAAAVFHKLPGELLDVIVQHKSKWAHKAIKDLKMPDGMVIASVLRKNDVLIATGDLVLAEGDRLVVFSQPGTIGKLASLFQK